MRLTNKVRFYPGHLERDAFWGASDCSNLIWNKGIQEHRDDPYISGYELEALIPELKQEFIELNIPCSQVLQKANKKLSEAYSSYDALLKKGDENAKPPGFRSRSRFFTLEYPQRNTSFRIEGRVLKLSHGIKRGETIDIILPDGNYDDIKTVKICFKFGKWYACLTYDYPEPPLNSKGHNIYFDTGSKTALTGIKSTGEFVEYDLKPLRDMNKSTLEKIDDLQSRKSRLQRGSKQYRRVYAQIQNLYGKLDTRTNLYLHTMSKMILKDHPDVKAFYFGDWDKRKTLADTGSVAADHAINRAVQNNLPLRKFISFIKYKGQKRGQLVDDMNEKGSTGTCIMCGHYTRHDPSKRMFECEKCHFSYSRDHHSCLNFVKKREPALWQRLLEGNFIPCLHNSNTARSGTALTNGLIQEPIEGQLMSSKRMVLAPFSCKPHRVRLGLYPSTGSSPRKIGLLPL